MLTLPLSTNLTLQHLLQRIPLGKWSTAHASTSLNQVGSKEGGITVKRDSRWRGWAGGMPKGSKTTTQQQQKHKKQCLRSRLSGTSRACKSRATSLAGCGRHFKIGTISSRDV